MADFFLNFRIIPKALSIVSFLFFILLSFSFPAEAAQGINRQINFQGKVVNSDGTNVADGNYDFEFTIYTAASGGSPVWTETRTGGNQVAVAGGIFRVTLGSVTSLPGSVDFNTDNLYLAVEFNNDGEMSPRVRFASVPYAFNAERVNGLTVTNTSDNPFSSTTTLKIADGQTVSFNNGLTFSGTNGTTITFQGSDTYVGRTTTDTLTNKTIGSTGLVFSGAVTDITTVSNEDLTLTANGSGNIILASTYQSGVRIGAAGNTPAVLSVAGGIGANAALIVNNTNDGDILAASSSGTTKFRIADNGDLIFAGSTSFMTTLTSETGNDVALTIPDTGATDTLCLETLANCADGGPNPNLWQINSGVLAQGNTTLDFAIGGVSTTSAKFAILNVNGSNAPIATLSATTSSGGDGAGLVFNTSGSSIESLLGRTLTIGGTTTGNITISPGSGAGILTIGSGTNGLTFDIANSGPTYSGTARPIKTITLSPEYFGAVLTASGSATINGSMTSDASSSASLNRTYYEWSSTQTSLHDYTVAVRVKLPKDFSEWATGNTMTIAYNTGSSVTATNGLDVYIYNSSDDSTGRPVHFSTDNVSAKTWTTINLTAGELDDNSSPDWDAADETVTIYLKMKASGTYNYTQIGDIVLNYFAKF